MNKLTDAISSVLVFFIIPVYYLTIFRLLPDSMLDGKMDCSE